MKSATAGAGALYLSSAKGRQMRVHPVAALINVGGVLYSTTSRGGTYNFGTSSAERFPNREWQEEVLQILDPAAMVIHPWPNSRILASTCTPTPCSGGKNIDGTVFETSLLLRSE